MSDRAHIDRYLAALFGDALGGSLIEVRWRDGARMGRAFLDVAERERAASLIARRAASTDVYVGVLSRRRRGGGRDDLVDAGAVLWADCDTPEAVGRMHDFAAVPSLVVASGTGNNRHAYWLLASAVPLDVIEDANHRIAATLGADPACADAARILRPPSVNHKTQPPAAVELLHCDLSERYVLDDVIARCPASPGLPHRLGSPRPPRDCDDPLLDVPPALYVEVLAGLAVPRHRKVCCPFHDDAVASLHVYMEPARGWYCFGCRRGGSVYDFAALLWGLSTRGDDFRLLQQRLDDLLSLHLEAASMTAVMALS